MLLEFEGFVVHDCESGPSALAFMKRQCADVLLIDYRMPEMNGDEVARRMRLLCPKALIIGCSVESKEREFLDSGADAFIAKSAVVHELVPLIRSRLEH